MLSEILQGFLLEPVTSKFYNWVEWGIKNIINSSHKKNYNWKYQDSGGSCKLEQKAKTINFSLKKIISDSIKIQEAPNKLEQ